ncbi:hypothetical protein B296_00041651, partial [Ensete ventricosum]
ETRFQKLKERLKVPFDECRRDHQVYCFFSKVILFKQEGMRATWAYPFAVGRHQCLVHVDSDARTAFSFLISSSSSTARPKSSPAINFLKALSGESQFYRAQWW